MRVEKSPHRFLGSLTASVGCHLVVCLIIFLLINNNLGKETRTEHWIQVETVTDRRTAKKDLKVIEKNDKRIVQTETGEKVEIAEADSNLGAQNQTVDRQT